MFEMLCCNDNVFFSTIRRNDYLNTVSTTWKIRHNDDIIGRMGDEYILGNHFIVTYKYH